MVNILKYIGPFLRSSSTNPQSIKNQLFYFSREATSHLLLYSRCGVCMKSSELKIKKLPSLDITTFDGFSPLLCVYKKGNPKLLKEEGKYSWNSDKFKKEINIYSNAYMTLSVLKLCEYYLNFKETIPEKYTYGILYGEICRKQLDFYATYLRNQEGVFIDKKQLDSDYSKEILFEKADKKFKFSDQALLMSAYYKYSCLFSDKVSEDYKQFSLDIFQMFLDYREDLYNLSYEELAKLMLPLNLFYEDSKNADCLSLMLDIYDIMEENYMNSSKLENTSLFLIDCSLLYKNTGYLKFKEKSETLKDELLKYYDKDSGILIKPQSGKDCSFTSKELFYNFLSLCYYRDIIDDSDITSIIENLYNESIINSGILLSWPEAPDLDDKERYRNYSLKSEDLLDESCFRNPLIPTLTSIELAPVISKNLSYNCKKGEFKLYKQSFDSTSNFPIYFLCLYEFKLEV